MIDAEDEAGGAGENNSQSKSALPKPGLPESSPDARTESAPPATGKDRRSGFREKARKAPESPGVYIMRDQAGTIIYVGKAKVLRNRLLSYFTGKKDIKTSHLVSRVESIDWTLADSEYDALILENNLIKEHSPKYNISLKDGRTYPSVRITAEEFPRVFRTRRIIHDGSEYFGPFPSAETIDLLLDLVDRLFPLRRCHRMKKREQPCMYYHIGRCPGPCAGKIGREAYLERVDKVRKLLSGQTSELLAELKSGMLEASAALRFEEAARLRDSIQALELFAGKTKMQDFDPTARDYLGWESDGDLCAFVVFSMREGKMVGRDSFVSPLYTEEEEAVQTFLMSYYGKAKPPPPFLYLKKAKGVREVSRFFRAELGAKAAIAAPREERHAAVMNLAVQNAREELMKRRREAGDLSALAELRDRIGLERLPRRIEGFDIAHLAGKHTVASLISFSDGVPDKKNYRYFKIRSLGGKIDDFASMREAVARRYSRLVNEEAELPDLVLVDGGAGQVSATKEVLDELGLECGLAGLAKKNEEIYLPGEEAPLILPRDSPALRILVALRDETHRFATGLSGRLRAKELKAAVLEAVEGIGEKRSKKLLTSFGSLAAIAEAEPERIAAAGGISRELALEVKARACAAS